MLNSVLDIFRMRQYFNLVVRAREVERGVRDDVAFLDLVRRSMVPLPLDRHRAVDPHPFAGTRPHPLEALGDRRIAVVATGGSGALASVVGVARALEESGLAPAVLSLCSGSALFGFPIAAGVPATDVAEFAISLRPSDYVDIDWRKAGHARPERGPRIRWAASGRAARSRPTATSWVTCRLGDMPIAAYAPIWNVEENRVDFIGPRTHPEMTVARAVRMAVALPLFFDPVRLDGGSWCDGGIVDIFPVHPVLDIEAPCDLVLAVNGFYPPGFVGEDASGWRERAPLDHRRGVPSAHEPAGTTGSREPGTARGRRRGAHDRARALRGGHGSGLLPSVPHDRGLARLHASGETRGAAGPGPSRVGTSERAGPR